MVVGVSGHLDGGVAHHLRHGSKVSAFTEQGCSEQVSQVVHPGRVGDTSALTGVLEGLPNRRQATAHVLDDEAGHRLVSFSFHALEKFGVDRNGPIGLGLTCVDTDGAGDEVHVLPAKGEELRLPRSSAQVEAHLHSPSQVRFGTGHDLLRVVQGQLQVPGLNLGLFPVLQRVDPGEAVVDPEMEDEAQVIAVLVHRVLGPLFAGAPADPFEVQDERNHVPLVGQSVDGLVTNDGYELVLQKSFDVANVLLGPPGCSHVIQVPAAKFSQIHP